MSILTRWNPFGSVQEEVARFQHEMDRLFNRFGIPEPGRPAVALTYPALNIWEDENFLYVEAELPGSKMTDVEIFVTGETQLTVKGARPPLEIKNVEWHRQERPFAAFTRVIPLPCPVEPGKIEACLEYGVLTIKMPKKEEARPRKIIVKGE
jgi:HSP20 family protein